MKLHLTYEFENEDELRAHLGGEIRSASTATVTATEVVRAPEPAEAPEAPAVEITAERDADGMPWNADYHSTPKSFTDDGLWRSKRGKAEEAKAARSSFKAAGGVTVPAAMPGMPVAAAPAAVMPTMAPPVPFERLVGKITGMMQRGILNPDSIGALYGEVGATSGAQFETNESLRAALFTRLCAIEPEVA
jgi:hypothetical protein